MDTNEKSKRGQFFALATDKLDSALTWYTGGALLWAAFGTAAKNSKFLGQSNFANAFIAGALLTVITMIGITSSLALFR